MLGAVVVVVNWLWSCRWDSIMSVVLCCAWSCAVLVLGPVAVLFFVVGVNGVSVVVDGCCRTSYVAVVRC